MEAACRELNSHGLTGVHAICNVPNCRNIPTSIRDLADEGRLTARVFLGFDRLPGCSIRTGLGELV